MAANRMARLGEMVINLVNEEKRELRTGQRYPTLERWCKSSAERKYGVFLTQDFDEVWLTPHQARRLIKDLQAMFPGKSRGSVE